MRGRFDDAIEAFKRPRDLESIGMWAVGFGLGLTYYCSRRFDSAIEQFRKLLEVRSDNLLVHILVTDAYACAGQREKCLAACEQALGLSGSAIVRLNVACTYAQIGKTEEARRLLQVVESAWQPGHPLPFFIAAAHTRLGEKDAAFEWLEKAFRQHDFFLLELKFHPLLDALHDDPRFDDLVKRIGIPD